MGRSLLSRLFGYAAVSVVSGALAFSPGCYGKRAEPQPTPQISLKDLEEKLRSNPNKLVSARHAYVWSMEFNRREQYLVTKHFLEIGKSLLQEHHDQASLSKSKFYSVLLAEYALVVLNIDAFAKKRGGGTMGPLEEIVVSYLKVSEHIGENKVSLYARGRLAESSGKSDDAKQFYEKAKNISLNIKTEAFDFSFGQRGCEIDNAIIIRLLKIKEKEERRKKLEQSLDPGFAYGEEAIKRCA